MKHLFFSAIVLLFSFSINAQTFDGVPISGDLTTTITKLKAKGYIFQKNMANGGAILKGKVATQNVDLYVYITPKTKQVCKFVVFFAEETSWYSLKSQYEKYLEILTEKYGEPSDKFAFFKSPYEEGDGYEMSAVTLEKAVFSSYWMNKDNTTIALSISKWKQVSIGYENDKNMELKNKEVKSMENNSF